MDRELAPFDLADCHAELAGVGWSFDATDDTAPDAEGQSLAMLRAMEDAALGPAEIDYINGKFVEYGERTGIDTPYNKTLRALVKGLESK